MKRNLLLILLPALALCMSALNVAAQGFQITDLNTSQNSLVSCDTLTTIDISAISQGNSNADFNLVLSGTNFQSSQFTVMVHWGDGNTTTHVGGTSVVGTPISFNPPIQHVYQTPGTYPIYVVATNPQNNSQDVDTLYYTKTHCDVYFFTQVSLDCDANGTSDSLIANGVPIQLSGQYVYQGTLNNGSIVFDNVIEGAYTVSIANNWLLQNNYNVAFITPQLINVGPNMTTFTSVITLHCNDSVPPNPNNLCLSGIMYCDADQSGTYTAGDTPIGNAPVQLTNGAFSTVVYTNPNGYYNINYPGNWNSPSIVTVSNAWLQQNGYTMNTNPYTVLADSCAMQPTLNLPVNCGANPCYYQCVAAIVFCDGNGNGVFDNGETPLPNAPITLWAQNQNQSVTVYTDSNGYVLYCGNGLPQQAVVAQLSPYWLQQHGYTIANPIVTLLTAQTPNPGYFAVNCGGGQTCVDLWTTATPWIGYYQNNNATIRLNYGNYGPGAPGPYTLTLTFPAGVTVNQATISNPNYTITGNTITWTLNSAMGSFNFTDYITFFVPMGIANGTMHNFTSTITPAGNVSDCYTGNNTGNLLQIVGNSYDPNDKQADLPENLSPVIDELLTFTVRFQNTGTAPAQNVYILDTLSQLLDWSTFEVLEATHPMHVDNLGDGVMRFNFPQIWLPDSTTNEPESHGHVVYRIREATGNPEGGEIFNTAYIYFDWNEAIITNTTYHVNTALGIAEAAWASDVFPNPFSRQVHIRSSETIRGIVVTDLSGKALQVLSVAADEVSLDLAAYSEGVYLIQVTTEKGTELHRVVKK